MHFIVTLEEVIAAVTLMLIEFSRLKIPIENMNNVKRYKLVSSSGEGTVFCSCFDSQASYLPKPRSKLHRPEIPELQTSLN